MRHEVNWTLIRILILISGTFIGALSLILGFWLMNKGATGQFEILGEGKGVRIFITSVSPGAFLALVGGTINLMALKIQKGSIGLPSHQQLRERGGVKYYEVGNNDENGQEKLS